MDARIIDSIIKEIEGFAPQTGEERVGRIAEAGDGIVEIEGLSGAMMSEILEFETASGPLEESLAHAGALYGLVLNVEEGGVKAIVLGNAGSVAEGMVVKSTGKILSVPVGEAIVGRVVNALAEPIDGKGAIAGTTMVPVEREAYGVMDRQPVTVPLQTGIKAIDAMIPIGRGQRELIIGDRFTGKTSIAIDTIINQKHESPETRPICIYVAVGQKESKTARIMAELREAGALEYTVIVDAPASAPAALQFLAPFTGAAIGEFFMQQGKDALVVYDDLSKQAVAYRELSLLLRRPPGREAYPGDIFYLHSRLLERAAKLSDALGGGSLTALPIIETQEGDVSSYIPTNVISITDGQIFLDAGLFNKGVRPAIDVGISVSRVGSAAQTKAMKSVAGTLRLSLAQFRELEAFMQFAQDLDAETAKRIDNGRRMVEVLKQGKQAPLPFQAQVVSLYAATNGYLDSFPIDHVREAELALLTFVDDQHAQILESIRSERKITDETKAALNAALEQFGRMQAPSA